MAILVVAPGDNSSGPRARATFPSIMARSFMARSPQWVWTALDPQSKLLLAITVGPRTQVMAQRIVHQVVQVLAPGCVPLFLTDGFKEYATALLTHFGQWVQPSRR